jgi:hypothetical protein
VEAVFVARNIDIKNVAVFEGPGVRNSMANDLVYGGAARPWEIVIIQWTWVSSLRNDVIVHCFINSFGGNPDSSSFMTNVNGTSGDSASFSYLDKILTLVNRRLFVSKCLKSNVWGASFGIIRFFNFIWNTSFSLKSIRKRSHGSSILKSLRIFFFLFLFDVAHFMELPKGLEALLTTEISRLES